MNCPECGGETSVTDSRPSGANVRRRRRCDNDHRFTTIELLVTDEDRRFRDIIYIDISTFTRPQRLVMRLLARQFGRDRF